MNDLAIAKKSKDFLKRIAYDIIYQRKFKRLNIDKSFSETIIDRSSGKDEKTIFRLIRKSRNQEGFENNVKEYLKLAQRNIYSNVLLIGNLTGKYVFNSFCYDSLKGLNIDAFSKENRKLLLELKSHFGEYIVNNNYNKNIFAERMKIGKSSIKMLSQDIDKESLGKNFEKVLNGEQTDDNYFKPKIVSDYILKIIGTYSNNDIKNNFDFILYDINSDDTSSLEDRRKKYLSHSKLSNCQIKKIDELNVLKERLQNMSGKESEQLLSRLNMIESSLDENITELEDIYGDYEVLYRRDLIENLYVPKEDITIIEDYRDMKPQLIHQFIRNPEKFRNMEIDKAKETIISERTNGDYNSELNKDEQDKLDRIISQIDANLDQYKVNYTTDGRGTIYTDSSGFEQYHSDTNNQISASVFEGEEFINSSKNVGIIGIGFNNETLTPDAIAISSNSYKTTNKGLNNIEYNEKKEFSELSAPFSELIKSRGKSEVVMHRRGMDFDTKASYIFATIDSSNLKQTKEIMQQLEEVRTKEGLKVVIYDINKIRESLKQRQQEKDEK